MRTVGPDLRLSLLRHPGTCMSDNHIFCLGHRVWAVSGLLDSYKTFMASAAAGYQCPDQHLEVLTLFVSPCEVTQSSLQ